MEKELDKEIVIIDGRVVVRKVINEYSMPLIDLAKKIVVNDVNDVNVVTPELPMNTIMYKETSSNNIYVIRVPEDNYTLNASERRGSVSRPYLVRIPNTIFIFRFKKGVTTGKPINVKMYWEKRENDKTFSLSSSNLVIPPLQNIYDNANICLGNYISGDSVIETINNYLTSFFENSFNSDLSSGKNKIQQVSRRQQTLFSSDGSSLDLLKCWWEGDNVLNSFKTKKNISTLLGDSYD